MKNERIVIQKAGIKTIFDEIKPSDTSSISKETSVLVKRDAKLEYVFAYLGGGKVEKEIEIVLDGDGAEAALVGIVFCTAGANFDLETVSLHKKPNTKANIFIKGVLKDWAGFDYRGLIKIEKKAQQTNSHLSDHTLILSKEAKAVMTPSLEIEADDVKASHEATVGQIDKEQVFYLMSRGLSKKEAEKMIVQGFLGSIIGRVKDSSVKDKLRGIIEEVKL